MDRLLLGDLQYASMRAPNAQPVEKHQIQKHLLHHYYDRNPSETATKHETVPQITSQSSPISFSKKTINQTLTPPCFGRQHDHRGRRRKERSKGCEKKQNVRVVRDRDAAADLRLYCRGRILGLGGGAIRRPAEGVNTITKGRSRGCE